MSWCEQLPGFLGRPAGDRRTRPPSAGVLSSNLLLSLAPGPLPGCQVDMWDLSKETFRRSLEQGSTAGCGLTSSGQTPAVHCINAGSVCVDVQSVWVDKHRKITFMSYALGSFLSRSLWFDYFFFDITNLSHVVLSNPCSLHYFLSVDPDEASQKIKRP